MCRLIGLIGTPTLPVREVLEAFFPLGQNGHVKCTMKPGHLDGWGISGFSAGRAVYFERRAEAVTEGKQTYEAAIEKAVKSQSSVVIGHLRKASEGARNLSNTHPFHARDWIFAHNGTVFGAQASFPLMDAVPQGDTDSERFFLWLMEGIRNEEDRTEALVNLVKKNRENLVYSALNFLMTDGVQLWAYREFGDKRYDPGETFKEREAYYTLYYSRLAGSALVCSEPLNSVSPIWQPIPQRTLAIFTPQSPTPRTISV